MIVIGLDPGTEKSAICSYDGKTVWGAETMRNEELVAFLARRPADLAPGSAPRIVLAVEKIESYGMAVGIEVLDTVWWSGRFAQAWGVQDCLRAVRVPRRDVKLHLCHTNKATDANIRQALIDRFGPTKEKAIGTKKNQGPLYDVKGHEISALAVAVTVWDRAQYEGQRLDVGF